MSLKRRSFLAASLALAAAAALPSSFSRAGGGPECVNSGTKLMVHEWGTFTVLQDEQGKPIGGINTDDERLPSFVKDISGLLASSREELPASYFMKGIAREHPDVYARLETPVTYFYPPAGWDKDKQVDVSVALRQGWLTQFYPNARAGGPDLTENGYLKNTARINAAAKGSLTWSRIKLHGTEDGPETTENTWLAPRKVRSATVHTQDGQKERYLFYRGVGSFKAPLNVARADHDTFQLRTDWPLQTSATIEGILLVDARPDGRCAFRAVDPVQATQGDSSVKATFPATFSEGEYSKENLKQVRAHLHRQLLHDGLLEEEANAMLNTWEVSYFKRPGLRLFFSVPKPWTEHMLPLTVSEPSDITRAMIGRIEIVTPQQRKTLATIAAGPASDAKWVGEQLESQRSETLATVIKKADIEEANAVAEGRHFALSGEKNVPADYLAYLTLGRFRNALVIDELKHRPTAELKKFSENYQLEGVKFAAE